MIGADFFIGVSCVSPRTVVARRSPSARASAARSCWFSASRCLMRSAADSRRRSSEASEARCRSGTLGRVQRRTGRSGSMRRHGPAPASRSRTGLVGSGAQDDGRHRDTGDDEAGADAEGQTVAAGESSGPPIRPAPTAPACRRRSTRRARPRHLPCTSESSATRGDRGR
jgi:hypothetical protein